jgi:hypothetical protein
MQGKALPSTLDLRADASGRRNLGNLGFNAREGTSNSLGFRVYLPDAYLGFYAREGTANSLGFRVYLPHAT